MEQVSEKWGTDGLTRRPRGAPPATLTDWPGPVGGLCWPYLQVRLLGQEAGRLVSDMVERKWVKSTNETKTQIKRDPNPRKEGRVRSAPTRRCSWCSGGDREKQRGSREGGAAPHPLRPGGRAPRTMHSVSDFQGEMPQWGSLHPLGLGAGGCTSPCRPSQPPPLSCSRASLRRPAGPSAQPGCGRGFLGNTNAFLNPGAGSHPSVSM